MKKILITGATGFIGQHCLNFLQESNYEIHAIFLDPNTKSYSKNISWHRCNLLNTHSVKNLMKSLQPTDLIHLAWFTDPRTYLTSPHNITWLKASLALSEEFIKHGGKTILVSGTCAEYDLSHTLCTEDVTPTKSVNLYSASKNSFYHILKILCSTHNVVMKWCRIFFLYGPNEKPNRLIPSTIQTLSADKTFICKGGEHIRDYLYIEDAAEALIRVFESEIFGVVNIGSGTPIKVKDIMNLIGSILNKKHLIEFKPSNIKDPMAVVTGNMKHLNETIRWSPKHSLLEGLKETIDWWKNKQIKP